MSPTTLSITEANAYGIFILPDEDEDTYMTRAAAIFSQAQQDLAENSSARQITKALFDIDPIWVPISYEKKGLYPWEAACTWVDVPASIQMQPVFKTKKSLLGLYEKDEVLAHEYVHACRACLQSDVYEELFAYLVSMHKKRGCGYILACIRFFLGPLFSSPKEAMACVLLSSLLILVAFFSMFVQELQLVGTSLFYGILSLFFVFISFCFTRLFIRLYRWYRTYCHFRRHNISPLKCMIRLTDSEIHALSRMSASDFDVWQRKMCAESFRFRLLFSSYGVLPHN